MKQHIKKLIPEWWHLGRHYIVAARGAMKYHFPSKKMIIIGVTGTKGKTSVINFIW
jgi:UDP-N-acetylmuramyl pentapeptide synthase